MLELSAIELRVNKTVIDVAKEQAGLPPESDFHITDFNYGVKIVANLLKKFLEDTNFIGVSVSNMIITSMIILIVALIIYNRVQSTSIKTESVM